MSGVQWLGGRVLDSRPKGRGIDQNPSLTTELAAFEHLKIHFHHFYLDLFNALR